MDFNGRLRQTRKSRQMNHGLFHGLFHGEQMVRPKSPERDFAARGGSNGSIMHPIWDAFVRAVNAEADTAALLHR